MFLGDLQKLLTGVYALDVAYDVRDFLITDPSLARKLERDAPQLRRRAHAVGRVADVRGNERVHDDAARLCL